MLFAALEDVLDAEVVVQCWPVDAMAGTARLPNLSLSRRRFDQRSIARQRCARDASVVEPERELMVAGLTPLAFAGFPCMPCVQENCAVFAGEPQRCPDFGGLQPLTRRHGKIAEPDLRLARATVDIDMRGLVALQRIRVEPKATDAEDRGQKVVRGAGPGPGARGQ